MLCDAMKLSYRVVKDLFTTTLQPGCLQAIAGLGTAFSFLYDNFSNALFFLFSQLLFYLLVKY
jgi:hypothetical protein